MKNIIAIGDIHGSAKWRDIVENHKHDTIVFLGDYLDPYEGGYDCNEILYNLVDIIDFKRKNRERVVLLFGNHDLHYISSDAEISTRYDLRLAKAAGILFVKNFDLFQYAYQVGNTIFTHAGISQRWFDEDFKGDMDKNIADQLNNPSDEQVAALCRVGAARGGGRGRIGGIFWADRSELTDPLHGFVQVVGHSKVDDITEVEGQHDNRIIYCDCLKNGKYYKTNY